MAEDDEEILLTPAQVRDLFKVSEKTLRRWRQEGIGPPFVRIDRVIRYDKKAVLAWLKEHQQTREDGG